jgi:hypothetical protein
VVLWYEVEDWQMRLKDGDLGYVTRSECVRCATKRINESDTDCEYAAVGGVVSLRDGLLGRTAASLLASKATSGSQLTPL